MSTEIWLIGEQLKKPNAMENFNMFVLHTIIRRMTWHRKRRNMWVHPTNIKLPEFGIFSHLHRVLLKDEEKFHSFF